MIWLQKVDNRKSLCTLRNTELCSDLQCIAVGSLNPFRKGIWETLRSEIICDMICLGNANLKICIAGGKLILVWKHLVNKKFISVVKL